MVDIFHFNGLVKSFFRGIQDQDEGHIHQSTPGLTDGRINKHLTQSKDLQLKLHSLKRLITMMMSPVIND